MPADVEATRKDYSRQRARSPAKAGINWILSGVLQQPAIYLFFMVLGQLGTSLTAWLTYEYEWQHVYYFMMGLLLLCILIIIRHDALS